jgi:hypothetical protein
LYATFAPTVFLLYPKVYGRNRQIQFILMVIEIPVDKNQPNPGWTNCVRISHFHIERRPEEQRKPISG